ncbi:hypothetical protein [Hydrogenophaga soli]|nr:hypothetical protein [Burkholderiaceae bacterium]
MGLLRMLLVVFLGGWAVGFGACGGFGLALVARTLYETDQSDVGTLVVLTLVSVCGLLLAWGAFRLALKVHRQGRPR